MRLVQLHHPSKGRRVGLVDHENLRLLGTRYRALYDLVWTALSENVMIRELIGSHLGDDILSYDNIYAGRDSWKLLPSFDHPHDPLHCVVSGTGLTHKKSAEDRDGMHQGAKGVTSLSDSMKIYLWGEEGGKPAPGSVGVQPEWFYKGNGTILKGHLSALEVPAYGLDGGEEPEVAGVYVIDPGGVPVRIGMTVANEFSDHIMEQQNYLYLAPSKLRQCAIGPELVIGPKFDHIKGRATIDRNGTVIYDKTIMTGETHITHSLANLEHHHFKYPQHRLPGQVHIHFFGAYGLSFSEGIRLQDGDEMCVAMEGFGRPLINVVKWDKTAETPGVIKELI